MKTEFICNEKPIYNAAFALGILWGILGWAAFIKISYQCASAAHASNERLWQVEAFYGTFLVFMLVVLAALICFCISATVVGAVMATYQWIRWKRDEMLKKHKVP